jgi:hypothetical protein
MRFAAGVMAIASIVNAFRLFSEPDPTATVCELIHIATAQRLLTRGQSGISRSRLKLPEPRSGFDWEAWTTNE